MYSHYDCSTQQRAHATKEFISREYYCACITNRIVQEK